MGWRCSAWPSSIKALLKLYEGCIKAPLRQVWDGGAALKKKTWALDVRRLLSKDNRDHKFGSLEVLSLRAVLIQNYKF